ncbi:GumC family protein [Vibrio mediterranei]|uniref:GumC family protein n=1 Tax=Vibrio mediterranei TaxID=689 RepID=UPI0022835E1E|nr:exopolysaccharide transport family protein [Vibrio mediterranei]MCY9855257.1 exopolysaccharide transport family protein [Vibrio mediterranei]
MIERGKAKESHVSFAPLFLALKTHGLKLCLLTLIVTGISIPLVLSMGSKYVSTATVLINAQSDNTSPIEPIEGYDSTRAQYYETKFNLMQSRVVLVEAVRALNLQDDPHYNGAKQDEHGQWDQPLTTRINYTLRILKRNLTFTAVRLTQLVYVSYESPDAKQAALVANAVAQAFIDYSIQQRNEKTQVARTWNQDQLSILKQQINAQKKEIEAFLQQQGLLTFRGVDGFETEQLGIVTNKLADAKERRLTAQANFELVNRYMKGKLSDLTSLPDISQHPQLQDLRIALIQAKRNLSDLDRRYGPKYSKVLEAKAEIAAIQLQTNQLLGELKLGLQKKYQAELIKENHYKALLEQHKQAFFKLSEKRDFYEGLVADLDKKQELYEKLYLRTTEHSLNASSIKQEAKIYDPAVMSDRPAKPNKPLLIVMVAMLTLIAGALAIVIRAATKPTISSLREMKAKLGVHPLADVPKFMTQSDSTLALVKTVEANQMANEIVHGVVASLTLADAGCKSIAVASTFSKEGATTMSYLLASAMSKHHSTLLIDLDYRSDDDFSKALTQGNQDYGFSDIAISHMSLDKVAVRLCEQFHYLAPGLLNESPMSFLSRPECSQVLRKLTQQYQRVVVNLPPLNDNRDAQLIVSHLDRVVVVVEADTYSVKELTPAIDKLSEASPHELFGVLNKVSDAELTSEESRRFAAQASADLLQVEELR